MKEWIAKYYKNVEEVRPGLFIKTNKHGTMRQVYPILWNGTWSMKNLFWPPYMKATLIALVILLGVIYGGYNLSSQYRDIAQPLLENPIKYCEGILTGQKGPLCTPILEKAGLCTMKSLADLSVSLGA